LNAGLNFAEAGVLGVQVFDLNVFSKCYIVYMSTDTEED
jgi:hypothetical protein